MKKISILLVLLVIFLDHVGVGLIYPIFSSMLFQQDSTFIGSDMSNAAKGWYFGLLLGAAAISAFFSSPILGALSDQKGRRPIYLFSLSLGVVGYLFCVFGVWIKSILILILARAINGIAMGNGAVVGATIVDLSGDSNEKEKTKNFGLYAMASGIGFAIGPFLGGWIATFGLIVPFFWATIITLFNLLLIYFLFKETNLVKKSASIKVTEGIHNLKKAFKIKNLRTLFLTICLFCFGWSLFYEFLPVIWLSDYGFSLKNVGLFFGFGSAIFALSSSVLIRPIVDRFKPLSILSYALSFMGITILFILLRPAFALIWIYLALVNFLAALAFPTYTTLVSNSVGRDIQGEILGVSESIQTTAFGISPLLAGSLLGFHFYAPMFLGGIATLLSGILLFLSKHKLHS